MSMYSIDINVHDMHVQVRVPHHMHESPLHCVPLHCVPLHCVSVFAGDMEATLQMFFRNGSWHSLPTTEVDKSKKRGERA